jgi:adenine/guanine phosphoribosyltransferase-like PRPP-binding protein
MVRKDKLVSAREKIVVVRFLENLLEEFGNLDQIAKTLNAYVDKYFEIDERKRKKGIFSVADLSRYTNRKALPTDERKNYLMSYILTRYNPASLVVKGIIGKGDFIDVSNLVSDICLLEKIAFIVSRRKLFRESFDKIVTCSIGGFSFAMTLSCELEKPMVNVCYQHPYDLEQFYVREVENGSKESKIYLQKDMLKKGERILLVDDIIRSGRTHQVIVNLLEEIGCEIPLLISLVGVGEDINITAKKSELELYILHKIIKN